MSSRRSFAALGALAASTVAACKVDSLSVRSLRLRPTASTPIATMLAGSPTYVASDGDLRTVREVCAKDLTAELDAPNPRASRIAPTTTLEAILFGRRPNEMHDFLAGLSEAGITASLRATASERSNGVWHPGVTAPSAFPFAPTIASASTGSIGPVSTRTLASESFWGTGPVAAGVPAEVTTCRPSSGGTPLPGGSVQGVIAYNRGACSREVSYREIVEQGHRLLIDRIHGATEGGIGSNTIEYSILSSFIRHDGGVLDAPLGGLVLFLRVVTRDGLGNAPATSWGKVRYELGLSQRHTITLRPTQLGWRHDEGWGRIFSEGIVKHPGLRPRLTAADGELVITLQDKLLENQLAGVRSPTLGALLSRSEYNCKPADYVATCRDAAKMLGESIAPLLEARRPSGDAVTPLFTQAEIDRMRCAIGDPVGCGKAGKDPDAIVNDRWVCRKPAWDQPERCDLVIPISRLLPIPDGMISVFFDEDELDNPAYVLEAASPGALCQPPAPPANRSYFSNVIEDGGPTS